MRQWMVPMHKDSGKPVERNSTRCSPCVFGMKSREKIGWMFHHVFCHFALQISIHAAALKPHQRAKNGRAASNALITQHAGKDKWEKELTTQDELVHTRKWSNGCGKMSHPSPRKLFNWFASLNRWLKARVEISCYLMGLPMRGGDCKAVLPLLEATTW